MLKFFQSKVGIKISSGYTILLILMIGVSLLSSARLRQIDATISNLTQNLSREKDLSSEINQCLLLVRYYANRYITAQNQEDLDLFNAQYIHLKNDIAEMEALIKDPQRLQIIASIDQDVASYGDIFTQSAALIRDKQKTEIEVLDTQSLILDNKFSALRVHITSLNDPTIFLSFGTAQTTYQTLRLNILEYLSQGDARYTVLAQKNYFTIQNSLADLKTSLSDPAQQANLVAAQDALKTYYDGFQAVSNDVTRLRDLLGQLNTLEAKVNDEATQINNSVNAEFERYNQQSRNMVTQTQIWLFVATIAAILTGSLLAFSLSRSITRSLGQVQRASHQLANTDIQAFTSQMTTMSKGDVRLNLEITSQPLNVDLNDEVGLTARSFNAIVASLYRAEKAFGEMSAYLNEMAQAAQKIGQGNLNVEITPRSSDDVLGNAILNMFEDLRAAQKQVKETQDHLEELVVRRTSELNEAKNIAEDATRSKSVFLANMSHELRTPLNAILGFAQLMARDAGLSPRQRENLVTIERSGEHLLSLINDVLEMSKIEAGRVTLNPSGFDLYNLLNILESMFRLRAESKNIQLDIKIDPNVPHIIRADQGKLRQVLINLLGNAIKFTEYGGVVLHLHSRNDIQKTGRIFLDFDIEDSGPGIVPDEMVNLFTPFTQTTFGKKSQDGTGLGLAISYQFVTLMGGRIKVTSQLGSGSTFSFSIPVELASPYEVEETIEFSSAPRVIGLAPDQPTYRILIVEDDNLSRQLMVKLLEPLGFETREAVNGLEGLHIWEEWQPDLIWMDMRMPVMDGHEATRRIKAAGLDKKTVIIALTASAFEEERKLVLSEGCDDFVRKPFRENEIFERINKFLGVKYLYEERASLDPVPTDARNGINQKELRRAVQSLEPDLLSQLNIAAFHADSDRLLELIAGMDAKDSPLAAILADFIHNFRLDLLTALIQPDESE